MGPLRIPVDDKAAALIPYRGSKHSFPYIPLADVVKDRIEPAALKGKIVLVGASAHGLYDLRSTPVGSVFPGVEIHANLIAGMLGSTIKQKPAFTANLELVLLLVGGVALAILIPLLSALWATLAAAAGIALIALFNLAVWTHGDMVLPLAASVAMTAVLYVMNMAYGYFVESRSKRQFTELFGQYVPPELVDRMAADPAKYNMEPRSAELTILFADVRGFTGISEALKPEELREYINEYLTDMSTIIRSRYRGTLDKYIGDAVMAFWGAPVEDPQHARNAVLAALDMQKDCEVLNAKFAARGWPALRIGVGVNSGHGARRRHGLAGAPRVHRDGRCGERRLAGRRPHQDLRGRRPRRRGHARARGGRGVPRGRPHQGHGQGRGRDGLRAPRPRVRHRRKRAPGAGTVEFHLARLPHSAVG